MENLSSGDVPALVSNIEILSILTDKIDKRKEQEAADQLKGIPRKQNRKLRHRDFIEDSVYHYLQSTACAYADIQEMPNLIHDLRNGSVIGDVKEEEEEENPELVERTGGFGLTDAETLQIMNLMPKEPVEIHLMIEELQNRFEEDRQQELLDIIAKYYKKEEAEEQYEESEENAQDYVEGEENPGESYE